MYKKILLFLLILLFGSHLIFRENIKVKAASGISVSPSIVKLDLSNHEPETDIIYKNNTDEVVELNLSSENFLVTEENKIKFLSSTESISYKYSLAQSIRLDTVSFSLKPKEQRNVKAFIDKDLLTPGTHYASIQAEIVQKQTANNITIGSALSNLIFVTTSTGSEREEAKIDNFQFHKEGKTIPTHYSFKFINSGNVELTPHGLITVKDMFGNVIGKGIINEDSLVTLPENARSYNIPVTLREKLFFPGYYTANLNIRYAKDDKEIQQTIKFFSFGNTKFLISSSIVILTFGILLFSMYLKNRKRKLKIKIR